MAENSSNKACSRCGGKTTTGTLKAGNQEATIVIAGEPDGFLGVIPYTTSQVAARVCTNCGLIEMYARNVRDLLRIDSDGND